MASLEYFRHDSRARRDKRLRLLRAKYGRNGVCIFWDMIEELAEDEDHRLPYNYDYLYLSLQCSSDEDKEALRFIIEESGLISIDENRDEIYSQRLIKHAGLVASKTNGTCNETCNESITEGNESYNETCNGAYNENITKVTEITEHNGEGNETCNENITERGGIIGGGKTPNNKIQNTKEDYVVSNSSLRSEFGAWALNFWNENVDARIPKLKSLTKDRLDKLISRCDEMGKRTLPEAQEHFAELIKRMNKSPFCKGDNAQGWKASFDWLVRNNYNQLKVLEGNYDPNSDEAYRQSGEYRSWRASRQANKNINDQW